MLGYTSTPIHLIYRDALEVAQHVFANPVFAQHMMFDPKEVYEGIQRQYGEFMTANHAFELQNNYPEGATMMPIILASDKTGVMRVTGNLDMHPTFLTIGNIALDVRMKATLQAWRCVAFIPTPKFNVHPDFQGILHAHLWHKCMDKVCVNLKIAAKVGTFISDPFGLVQYVFTPLVAYQADLLEQQLIACVAKNSSPVSLAMLEFFGDPRPHSPCTGSYTLKQIYDISKKVNPWQVGQFQTAAKAVGLSGVQQPFWRDWHLAKPSKSLTPEILHTCHKFFFDHILMWCKSMLGNDELDTRYKSYHKRISFCHFTKGASHIKQMTGRDHCDIQRTIVPTIASAASNNAVHSIHGLIDLFYLAQNPTHTPTSIDHMMNALAKFHHYKDAILEAEARRGKKGTIDNFHIPKLKLMQSFARAYTADVPEHLLIINCKHTFQKTNHQKDFIAQSHNFINAVIQAETEEVQAVQDETTDLDPEYAWLSRVVKAENI
ncbi:hypothetical protein SERLA73DRAFT_68786 [Serpula lacrymans var. lacrymans S7.3]|uniref:Uncharacterized protein n=1 Tax=Serpula lacrymans var. lacrymans (strain S7.3) TaxID=936435 RepID=F8PIB2_SERL3|nr:hypothetical protein SERLA73DRAFT_68786 [Serpula lacrymans var. lacrymans S7.3]